MAGKTRRFRCNVFGHSHADGIAAVNSIGLWFCDSETHILYNRIKAIHYYAPGMHVYADLWPRASRQHQRQKYMLSPLGVKQMCLTSTHGYR